MTQLGPPGTRRSGLWSVAGNSEMPWLAISALRLLGGGVIMLAVTAATGELRRVPRTAASIRHIATSAAFVAVAGAAYFQGVALAGVAVVAVLSLGSAPLFVAGATAVRRRRMPGLPVMAAMLVAVVGLVLVSDISKMFADDGSLRTLLGIGLGLLSGAAFGATTIINRRVIPGLSPAPLIATSFTLAGLLSLTWSAAIGFEFGSMTVTAWSGLAYLSVVQAALGFLLFYIGLQRGVLVTNAAILSLVEPCTATVLAVLVLGEPLSAAGIVGLALLLTAVILVRPARAGGTTDVSGSDQVSSRQSLTTERTSCRVSSSSDDEQ